MAHAYAMLMLYAAVYGPATFADRFGEWQSLKPKCCIAVPDVQTVAKKPASGSRVAKPPVVYFKAAKLGQPLSIVPKGK